jgi:hypothetical protein
VLKPMRNTSQGTLMGAAGFELWYSFPFFCVTLSYTGNVPNP